MNPTATELLDKLTPCCPSPRFRFIYDEQDGFPMVKCDACGTIGHDGHNERNAVYMWNVERPHEPDETHADEFGRRKRPDATS